MESLNNVDRFEISRADLTQFVSLIQELPFKLAAPILNFGDKVFRPLLQENTEVKEIESKFVGSEIVE